MKTDLQKAKELLVQQGCTCVLCKGEEISISFERGVKPLLGWLEENPLRNGFSAADRVVGRAAAFRYLLLGVGCIYAGVISKPALQLLQQHHVSCEYDTLVPAIRNRAGDGFCPMENAVLAVDDPAEALAAIREKLRQLQNAK